MGVREDKNMGDKRYIYVWGGEGDYWFSVERKVIMCSLMLSGEGDWHKGIHIHKLSWYCVNSGKIKCI